MHDNIEFILKREKEEKLAFLDILIIRKWDNFEFEILRSIESPVMHSFWYSYTDELQLNSNSIEFKGQNKDWGKVRYFRDNLCNFKTKIQSSIGETSSETVEWTWISLEIKIPKEIREICSDKALRFEKTLDWRNEAVEVTN